MKSLIFFIQLSLLSICSNAQINGDYLVEKRDSGFVLIQNGRTVPFDTTQVQTNLAQKADEVSTLETEIALLERLVMLRRQLSVARDEKRTLFDIIEKARKCENTSSKK